VPVWLGIGVVVLAAVGGGGAWLLRDELFHPFGDARACAGSDLKLPGVITAGGATIPTDASDVHYYTRNGSAQVTFTSGLISDYLHRAGIVPEGKALFDKKYGEPAVDDDELALPDGLCGSSLRGPAWAVPLHRRQRHRRRRHRRAVHAVPDAFRFPARVVVGYTTP
jgi:hypothetical protein